MSYSIESLSENIQIRAFKNVRNPLKIAETAVEDVARMAVVDLNMVASEFHLKTAVVKALVNECTGKMKTKSISSEMLYQVSATTNINESTKHCGIGSESITVAFVFARPITSVDEEMFDSVDGEGFDIATLASPEYLDKEKLAKLVKLFKITAQELEFSSLDHAIATRLATKDCL